MKNNIDVFYFSTLYPLHILFVEDGKMGEWEHGWLWLLPPVWSCHSSPWNPPDRVPGPGDAAGNQKPLGTLQWLWLPEVA